MPLTPAARRRVCASTVGALGVGYGLASTALALGPAERTSYAGRMPLLAALAGLALVGASVTGALDPREGRTRGVATVVTVVWFSPVWVGWADGPAVVRGVAALAAPFLLASVVHVVAANGGWPAGRSGRVAVGVAYAAALPSTVVRALFRDPLRDPACWDNCVTNLFLVRPEPQLVHAADVAERWSSGSVGALLVLVSCIRLLTVTTAARRTLWPVLGGAAVVGASAVVRAAELSRRAESASDAGYRHIFVTLAVGVVLVAAGPMLTASRETAQRRSLTRITTDLAARPEPGRLQEVLALAVGDPRLTVSYWVHSQRRFVDAAGDPVGAPDGLVGGVTTLTRNGAPLAQVRHEPAVVDAVRALGAGAQLVMDNERLSASLLAQAKGIEASRRRIVEAGDTARREAERDLHDGAQQRLLALSYRLRLARDVAEQHGETDTMALLDQALERTLAVLAELRDLAHGISPVSRSEDGLQAALDRLVDTASLPVAVVSTLRRPPSLPVASTVYEVVRNAVEDAAGRSATTVDVTVDGDDDRVVVTVRDDGTPPVPDVTSARDRVGVIGGNVRVGNGWVEAEVPCG